MLVSNELLVWAEFDYPHRGVITVIISKQIPLDYITYFCEGMKQKVHSYFRNYAATVGQWGCVRVYTKPISFQVIFIQPIRGTLLWEMDVLNIGIVHPASISEHRNQWDRFSQVLPNMSITLA